MAIEDYFKGSSQAYGQLAGSLLAGRRKEDKEEAKRALLASTIMATFGALQNQQKQNIIDGVNDVNTKYNEIFNLNKSEFEAYEDERALLKKYNDNKETFLNEEVAKIIDNTDEAVTARVKWADVDNQPDENLRKSMYAAYNSEREKLINRMESLKLDPRATTKTFEKFNQRAAEEYKAALALVEDDPTKKGLIRAAWNRIFKRQEDPERLKELQEAGIDVRGDLVTTNAELIELQDALIKAKENRTTFRDSLEDQIKVEKLYEPLVFKPKPKDLSEVYYSVIPSLKDVFAKNENYKNLDDKFYVEVINDVMEKNPSLNIQQIGQTAYMQLVQGDIDTEGYLTKEGIKIANGKALINTFEEQIDKDSFIKNNHPFKLLQLMDAYDREGDTKMSSGLAVRYKDILETNQDFKPTEQDKLNNIQRIRLKLKPNAKQYKSLLSDNDALATLGANSSYALNYYKQNNPNWSDKYTEVDLQEASINFVLRNTFVHNSPNEIRMTKADTMGIKGFFDVSLIDELPEIVEELTNINANKEKLQIVRDSFIANINNPSLELEEDEILELTNKVNNAFKDTNLEEEESGQELIVPKPNITEMYKEKGVIKTHFGRKLTYLTNWEENVDELDLSKLSINDLGYLASIKGNELYNYLGLDTNISLTPFRVQGLGYEGGIKSLHSKARQAMEQKLMNEENISRFKASGLVSGMFMNKDNNFNILKDDETINKLFENLKNNILS
jgi:hypothetical protein